VIILKIFDRIDNYLIDKKYKIIIMKNYLDIINYDEILDFSDKEIKVRYKEGITKIIGDNLVISRMLDDEIVVIGNIISLDI
jgi:sporulation protein YqfC